MTSFCTCQLWSLNLSPCTSFVALILVSLALQLFNQVRTCCPLPSLSSGWQPEGQGQSLCFCPVFLGQRTVNVYWICWLWSVRLSREQEILIVFQKPRSVELIFQIGSRPLLLTMACKKGLGQPLGNHASNGLPHAHNSLVVLAVSLHLWPCHAPFNLRAFTLIPLACSLCPQKAGHLLVICQVQLHNRLVWSSQ